MFVREVQDKNLTVRGVNHLLPFRLAYLGTKSPVSSPRSLCHSCRWPLARRCPLDSSPLSLLPPRPRPPSRLPRQVRRRLAATIPATPTHLRRNSSTPCPRKGIPLLLTSLVPSELGRLCQATLRRSSSCAGLSRPLHPSRGHHQS